MNSKARSFPTLVLGAALFVAPIVASTGTALAKQGGNNNKIEIFLTSTGIDPDATGKATFFLNANRDRFNLSVKNLPLGDYDFSVGGVFQMSFAVTNDESDGTKGKIKVDPKKSGSLNFDPRGQTIDISQGSTVFLTIAFPLNADQIANVEFGIDLVSSGLISGAEGEAEFKLRNGRMDFNVEIEQLPSGDYGLLVDGVSVGTIHAVARPDSGKVKGELEFSTNMNEVGEFPLTFDPRGKLIEVTDGTGAVILSVTFPAAPAGV